MRLRLNATLTPLPRRWILVALAGILCLTERLHAQPPPCTLSDFVWRTVDDFQLVPGQRAEAQEAWVAPNGDVYVVGLAETVSSSFPFTFDGHWIVRKSSDGGQTWSTVRDFKLSGSSSSSFDSAIARDVGPDLNGNVFVVGQAGDGSSVHWIVERSTDGGASWTVSDDFQLVAATSRSSLALSYRPDVFTGYLYVSGSGGDAGNVQHAIVRRSTDGGVSWLIVEDESSIGTPGFANDMIFTQLGEIVYVGAAFPNWIAKKSPTGNPGSWLLQDVFSGGVSNAVASAVFLDSVFDIYAAGQANTTSGFTGFVRKSTDDGNSWATIRQFQLASGFTTIFTDGAANLAGNVFLSVQASDGASDHWLVHRSSDGGATWITEDDFQLFPGAPAGARGIATRIGGSVYAVGFANDGTGPASHHWVVRKINVACADAVLRGVQTVETASFDGDHTCAVVEDPGTFQRSAKCWGRNNRGQIGNGATVPNLLGGVPVPTDVVGGGGFFQIDLGLEHTCSVSATDTAKCWGQNFFGQLGVGDFVDRLVPTDVSALGSVAEISAGHQHTCAVVGLGAVCWGQDGVGALGNGPGGNSSVPVAVSGLEPGMTSSVVSGVSAGFEHTCAVVDNSAMCWGAGGSGQLGDGSVTNSQVPVNVSLGPTVSVRKVLTGEMFSCALVDDAVDLGKVLCWGDNFWGTLGNGARPGDSSTPVEVIDSATGLPILNATQIAVGNHHACALFGDGSAKCWGRNVNGQLGDQQTCGAFLCDAAVNVMGLSGLKATYLSAGENYTCAVLERDIAACWGERDNYKLGDGLRFGNQLLPTPVLRP